MVEGQSSRDFARVKSLAFNQPELMHQLLDVLADSVKACDIVNIDGMGVVWGARLCGHQVPERVAGVDLFHQLWGLSNRNAYPVLL